MKTLNLIKKSFLQVLFFTFVFALLLSATNLLAECTECGECVTNVPGGDVPPGSHWTKAGSPYCVEGDISVTSLIIDPGVRVCFLGNYVLEVAGIITAVGGPEEEEIIFTKHEDNLDGWQGILFNYSSASSILKHCRIECSINSGIRIVETLPTIEDCKITGSRANHGGGMSIQLSSEDILIIKDSLIENNISNPAQANGNYVGGGIYANLGPSANLLLSHCEIKGNTSNSRCNTPSCTATGRGGGIYKTGLGKLTLEGCIVENNLVDARENYGSSYAYAKSYGGGVYVDNGELEAVNSVIKYNRAYALSDFYSTSNAYGGGIHLKAGISNITNCTVRNNLVEVQYSGSHSSGAADGGGLSREGGTMTVVNSILFFNQKRINGVTSNSQIYGSPTVTYSDVQDGYEGEGNINQNPSFIDNHHIDPISSPCIDVGNNEGITGIGLPGTDIDGEPRICDGDGDGIAIVDMGVDEVCKCTSDEQCPDDDCNTGKCNLQTGECYKQPKPEGTACDDGKFCTKTDKCQSGQCVGSGNPCPDDGLYCNGNEGCDEDNNICTSSGDPCAPDLCCDEEYNLCYMPPCDICKCDVSGDGQCTPQDALCSFQVYLGICPTACGACEDICCDVNEDGRCTPADALCRFQEYLGIHPNCFDQ